MKLKFDPARFRPAVIAPFLFSDRSRRFFRAPLMRGVGISVAIAVLLIIWVAIKSDDTLRALDAASPSVAVVVQRAAPPEKPPEATVTPLPTPAADGSFPGLIEQTPSGPLPRIGADGLQPWRAYARPAEATNKPRVAILMMGLGLAAASDERAIKMLPGPVSLAFLTYSDRVGTLLGQARVAGHEVMLNAPMEPDGYPADDPGPRALLVKAPPTENISRLEWDMARGVGYVGVAPAFGSRFTASPEPLQPILTTLAHRGLLYIDTGAAVFSAAPALAHSIGVPIVIADRTIDKVANSAAIDRELAELENTARSKGAALGVATPYPVTFDRLAAWIGTLEAKGIALVPVSALVDSPGSTAREPTKTRPGG